MKAPRGGPACGACGCGACGAAGRTLRTPASAPAPAAMLKKRRRETDIETVYLTIRECLLLGGIITRLVVTGTTSLSGRLGGAAPVEKLYWV